MAVARQDLSAGRVNQKRRTRAAIVAAARQLLHRGAQPTVAEAAEEALVSRATAYRYFPTQESLLLELSVNINVSEIEELVARPHEGDDARERVLELFDVFNRNVLANELPYRTALRLYLDMWLAAARKGEDPPIVRAGRRTRWIADSLAPLRDRMPEEDLRRLEAALCLVTGAEAIVVLRDVCQLDADEALGVARWAAEAILQASPTSTRSSANQSGERP